MKDAFAGSEQCVFRVWLCFFVYCKFNDLPLMVPPTPPRAMCKRRLSASAHRMNGGVVCQTADQT